MRISVRRTGGFAGLARTWECDTAALPADRAARIEEIVDSLAVRRAPSVADGFSYEVTVDGESRAVEDAEELIGAIEVRGSRFE